MIHQLSGNTVGQKGLSDSGIYIDQKDVYKRQGYSRTNVQYLNLSTQEVDTVTFEEMDQMVNASGNTFVGYTQ